jgi:hypothetical protein
MTANHKPARNTRAPHKAPDVELLPCPAGGTHELTNTPAGITLCAGCGDTWSRLDELARTKGKAR